MNKGHILITFSIISYKPCRSMHHPSQHLWYIFNPATGIKDELHLPLHFESRPWPGTSDGLSWILVAALTDFLQFPIKEFRNKLTCMYIFSNNDVGCTHKSSMYRRLMSFNKSNKLGGQFDDIPFPYTCY